MLRTYIYGQAQSSITRYLTPIHQAKSGKYFTMTSGRIILMPSRAKEVTLDLICLVVNRTVSLEVVHQKHDQKKQSRLHKR